MRRFLSLCLILCASASLTLAADPKPPFKTLEVADGDTIVFLGDSITQQCLYTQYIEDYFYTRFPHLRLHFHNSGVGGDRASDALIRFDRDVAAYHPRYVTVLLGMNDGGVKPYDETTFQTYRTDMLKLIEKIVGIGATPILVTPTMYDSKPARAKTPATPAGRLEFYNAVLAYYGAWVREIAGENGYGFADMYGPLNSFTLSARKKDPKFTMIPDAVHPGPAGQIIMAWGLLADTGVSRSVSTLVVERGAGSKAVVKATGGKATDANFTNDGAEFVFQATSLPLVVPADTKVGAALIPLGHRLSREVVEVHGLAPGRYEVRIDDTPVGVYTNEKLETGVEIQANAKTPQYQQSEKIAALNADRNEKAVAPLRMLWRSQKVARIKRLQAEAAPDNASLKEELAKLEAPLADFEGQIKTLESKATEIEDQIYQANRPQSRRYRIVKVEPAKKTAAAAR